MTINIAVPRQGPNLEPRITVIGVGGAGGNAVNNMIRANLEGVDFVVANTDNQALRLNLAERRIQLGPTVTKGLGAGARPEVGRAAAEEVMDEIAAEIEDSNMVFIPAGMGGGTGTGAGPVIAQAARERNILTVGVVTKPFHFEGPVRMRLAEEGIQEFAQYVDTLIVIPNQNLFRIANEKTTFADAFNMADTVLQQGVRGITDLMVMPGLINLDFADIQTVMSEMGKAMMGTGEATGEERAATAAEAAISNPLLDDISMKGASGVLISITGGMDMTLFEVDEAANRIRQEIENEANIIIGSTFDERLEGRLRVSVVATGIADESDGAKMRPRLVTSQPTPPVFTTVPPQRAAEGAVAAGAAAAVMAEMPAQADNPEPNPIVATEVAQPQEVARMQEAVAAEAMSEPEVVVAPPPPASATAPADVRLPDPNDRFVPPAPVSPGSPVAEEPVPAAPRVVRRKRSLFDLVTGRSGRRVESLPAEPKLMNRAPEAPAVAATAVVAPRPTESRVDDDMVQIPAFLRRDVN